MPRLLFVVAVGLLACGCGASTPATSPTGTNTADDVKVATTAPTSGDGQLSVVSGDGNLGEADYGERRSTTFTLRNGAGRPLTLQVADKSCECAGVEVKPTSVAPGQTAQVTVAWEPKMSQSTVDAVRVRTTIQAKEDPNQRLMLEADGRIKPTLRMNLPNGRLDFGKLLVADLKSGKKELAIEVFTEDDKRRNFTLEAKSLSQGLQVSKPEPLSPDRLLAHGATAGYRVTVRPVEGLPAGAFREIVRLRSDVYPGRDLDITVDGLVESGAVGLSRDGVDLPAKIPLARGYVCPPLEIELRGEPGRTLTIESVSPKFLKARLEAVAGKENSWRLHAQVPAGEDELRKDLSAEQLSEYTSFGFDGGAIELRSDHPRVPRLRIPVSPSQFQR